MSRRRLVLADDHLLVLEGLEALLSSHYDVVARVGDGVALLDVVARLQPDLVVSDISMPELDGLQATARIRVISPSTKIVLVTMSDEPALAVEARKAGASGYVLKTQASSRLVSVIEAALADESAAAGGTNMTLARPDAVAISPDLTPRQLEVLRLLGKGLTMKEIGAALHISKRTVAFHKYRIMELLGLETNVDLVRCALSLELRRG